MSWTFLKDLLIFVKHFFHFYDTFYPSSEYLYYWGADISILWILYILPDSDHYYANYLLLYHICSVP